MKKNRIKILKADEGMLLYNGKDVRSVVQLLETDDETEWKEITKEEADLIEQQKQVEENDNINN